MSLVGDIIMELRTRIPDAPGVSNGPQIVSLTSNFVPGGGPVYGGGGVQSFAATSFNQWGETGLTPGDVHQITPGPNDNQIIVQVGSSPAPNFLGTYIYQAGDYTAGGSPNALFDRYGPFPIVTGSDSYILGAGAPPGSPGSVGPTLSNPPLRYTAYHPDTDGNFIGAYTAFRLLNRAITEMVKIAGGIIDVTGVQTQVNQSMYRIDTPNGQGSFYQFVNAWFDGYPMDIVQRSMMYLRNSAAGFSGILSYEQDGPSSVIQVWPQSNRMGGQSNVIGLVNPNDNSFIVGAGGEGFLSIGLAQIDQEVVVYSQVQQQSSPGLGTYYLVSGVTRGMSGTRPATHQPGAQVTELNLRLSGYRMPPIYQVGDSAKTLMVPQAWETPLVLHMLSQVRSMEQDDAASKSLMGDFVQMAEKIAKGSRLGKLKPRQIPIWGQTSSDARNVNGIGFGWLVQ